MDDSHNNKLLELKWSTGWEVYGNMKTIGLEMNYDQLQQKELDDYLHKQEGTSVFDLLGKYSPQEHKITLYKERINTVARQLKCKLAALEDVVFAHETAHALIHLGIRKDSRIREGPRLLKHLDRINKGIDSNLHEQFAQIIAYNCIKTSKNFQDPYEDEDNWYGGDAYILKVYNKLEEHQPVVYRIEELKKLDGRKLLQVIGLFKFGELEGTWDNWDTIINFKSSI